MYDRVYKKKCLAPNFLKTIEREQKSNSYLNSEQKNNQIGIKSSKLKIELFKKDLKEIEASSILLTYLT